MELTHFDKKGNARMVDVTEKTDTVREALAVGKIFVSREVFEAAVNGTSKKGDVLTVATTAAVAGAKRTWELIPMCHIIPLSGVSVEWEALRPGEAGEDGIEAVGYEIRAACRVKCTGKTGVEMEALTGVTTALLTVYDMVKAIDKKMTIGDIYLAEKTGGKSGDVRNLPGEMLGREKLEI